MFIADTLSQQNKNQFDSNNIPYIEMKNNKVVVGDFKKALDKLNISHK